MPRRYCLVGAALVIGVGAGTPARADIVSANWTNSTLFNYRVTHMPDLDQKRDDLPCNGSIHCVPTCAANMVMYAANHGFPQVTPGPGYWEGDTNYDLATNVIGFMGILMQTSCDSGGTNGSNANAGLSNWLGGSPLVVNDHLDLDNFSVTFTNIGKSLCGGRIGSVSWGRYNVTGFMLGVPIVERNGGHCTTAVKVRRNGGTRELWVRDPASDESPDDLDSQSPFFNDILDVQDILVFKDDVFKLMTAVNYTPGDMTIRLLDGHRTLTPAQGYSWGSSLTVFQVMQAGNFINPGLPPVQPFGQPEQLDILSFQWGAANSAMYVVCASEVGPRFYRVEPLTGEWTQIQTPIAPLLVATGRSDNVYIVGSQHIIKILDPAPQNPPTPPGMTLPHAAHAIVFDDAADQVVLLSRTDRKLMRFNRELSTPPQVFNVPTAIPMGTQVQIAINPKDPGAVWLWSNAANALFRLIPGSGPDLSFQPFSHNAIPSPVGVDFDDRGHMFVSNQGAIAEFRPTSAGGWQLVTDGAIFAGLSSFGHLRIMKSRSNFEPGVHDTPGWSKNIDPAELPENPQVGECPADIAPLLNTDGLVNVSDLLLLINMWGKCPNDVFCPADIDGSGEVDVLDLLAAISAWGACPQ